MNTHPEHGMRVRFDLCSGSDDGALYRVTLYSPEGLVELNAALSVADGSVQLADAPAGVPDSLLRTVTPFAKQILSGRRADPTVPWPRRVLRWRQARPSN